MVTERERQERAPSTQTDKAVADEVAHVLAWTTAVPVGMVLPTVSHGWVNLVGTVEHEEQRYAAERAVRHVAGVTGVTNAIGIRQPFAPVPRVMPSAARLALTA